MDARIYAEKPDGERVEITEGVQALYDLVISSMNWGSGFLTVEDALPVVHVAKTCGFDSWHEAEAYVTVQQHSEEQANFIRDLRGRHDNYDRAGAWRRLHDHVYSSVGRCMWPGCGHQMLSAIYPSTEKP